MSDLLEPEYPVLPPEAVELLTAIRDSLDIPLYAERDKQARRDYRNVLESRVADVVAALNNLLGVAVGDAVAVTQMLRESTADTPARYAKWEGPK